MPEPTTHLLGLVGGPSAGECQITLDGMPLKGAQRLDLSITVADLVRARVELICRVNANLLAYFDSPNVLQPQPGEMYAELGSLYLHGAEGV